MSQSAKKKVDQETLLRLASRWLTPARAEQFNPMVLAETAIVVDLSSEINEVTSNEIARFARSENLTVIALSTSELSEQAFLVRMQSSGVRTERLGLLLSPQQTIGLLAKSSLVISANPQIVCLGPLVPSESRVSQRYFRNFRTKPTNNSSCIFCYSGSKFF